MSVTSFLPKTQTQGVVHTMRVPTDRVILCVGSSLLFSICDVCEYPTEDLGYRCLEQKWARGGNACNNCTVLRIFDVECEYLGTVANNTLSRFLTEDMVKFGIKIDNVVYIDGADCPCSTVIVNKESGSRTILHANKSLPELTFQHFRRAIKLDSGLYSWIHFEGRYEIQETREMLKSIDEYNNQVDDEKQRIKTSVEVEKCRSELGDLIGSASYVFISKDFAKFSGYHTKEEAVEKLSCKLKEGSTLICAWGEDGAAAKSTGSQTIVVPAYPPKCVVDTLGAGDTFVAATIFALSRGDGLKDAIDFGCKVAGAKVGMRGFEGLRDFVGS